MKETFPPQDYFSHILLPEPWLVQAVRFCVLYRWHHFALCSRVSPITGLNFALECET